MEYLDQELSADIRSPDKTSGDPLANWAQKQMQSAAERVERWRKQAKDADRFMAGRQFSRVDLQKLEQEQRPNAAFNVAQKFIRFVSGIERTSQQEMWFLPREVLDEKSAQAGALVT